MYTVLILLSCLKIQKVLCQFPPHMDLQKMDELVFEKSKYNVLRPTIHTTRDHFKDFIQKRNIREFPGRKVLVDRNGIRHYWSGLETQRRESLRKAVFETNVIGNDIKIAKGEIDSNKDTKLKANKEESNNKAKITEVTKKLKRGPLRKKKITESATEKALDVRLLRSDRTKVKTTFFCPFFGVITMISYID